MIAIFFSSIRAIAILFLCVLLGACSAEQTDALKRTDSGRTIAEGALIGATIGGLAGAATGDSRTAAAGAAIGGFLGSAIGTGVAITKGKYVQREDRLQREIAALRQKNSALASEIRGAKRALAQGRASVSQLKRLRAARVAGQRQARKTRSVLARSPKPTTQAELRKRQEIDRELQRLGENFAAASSLEDRFNV